MVLITQSPINVEEVIREISTPRSGGLDIFLGTVRNHSRGRRVRELEYSAYVPMAEKLMAEIENQIKGMWVVDKIVIIHRTGLLKIGEVSVVTAVSAPHRKQAFEACRYAIDSVKSVVPIWKKEYFEEGTAWVVGQHEVDVKGPEPHGPAH